MSQFAWTFPAGKIVDNYMINLAGAGDGYNVSNTEHKITVPTGKLWRVLQGSVKNDANGTTLCELYDDGDKLVGQLSNHAANTAQRIMMQTPAIADSSNLGFETGTLIIPAGWYIKITLGAAQSTAAYLFLMVMEIDAP